MAQHKQNRRCLVFKVDDDLYKNVRETLKKAGMTDRQISRAKYREDGICLNGRRVRVTEPVKAGDEIRFLLEDPRKETGEDQRIGERNVPECARGAEMDEAPRGKRRDAGFMKPSKIYEDEDILVVNKPADMAVHPSHGHHGDTVTDLLQETEPDAAGVCWHVVGRLDKETSGLLLLAKHAVAAARLSKRGRVEKEYEALVCGCVGSDELTIDLPIRKRDGYLNRMEAVKPDASSVEDAKRAVTHVRVLGRGKALTLVRCILQTGRTHQIRVHMAAVGHPLLGDRIYGETAEEMYARSPAERNEEPECGKNAEPFGEKKAEPSAEKRTDPAGKRMTRAALHCVGMRLVHPVTGEHLSFEAPLPEDMKNALETDGCYACAAAALIS